MVVVEEEDIKGCVCFRQRNATKSDVSVSS